MFYDAIEIVAAGIMLLYLWLEYRASIWLWPVGVVIPAFYIYIYYVNKFYADMGVNVYYLFASAYGWYRWQRGHRAGRGSDWRRPTSCCRLRSTSCSRASRTAPCPGATPSRRR